MNCYNILGPTVTRIAYVGLALFLSACSTTSSLPVAPISLTSLSSQPTQSSSSSEMVLEQFLTCKKEGILLDESAREQGSPAQYTASARTLDLCLVEVDQLRNAVPMELRMQVHALTVLNYLKGGDIENARLQLRAFELSYPHKDLYFSDYTSFIDSLNAVLGNRFIEKHSIAASSSRERTSNINPVVSSEVSRFRYWQTH